MKTEDNSRDIQNESIILTSNKYAAHSFYIVFAYILISSVIKMYVLEINMVYWFDTFIIILVASGYYTIRGIKSGIFIIIRNENKKRFIYSSIIGAAIFGVFHFIGGMEKSFLNNLLESIIVSILWGVIFYFLMNWTIIKSKKNIEKILNDKEK